MKKHVITLSKNFPSTHPRKGEPTQFVGMYAFGLKLHTIRENYEWWKKKIDEVNAGIAQLEIREWTGTPYYSPQKTLFIITEGLGYQKIDIRFKKVKKAKQVFFTIDGLPLIGADPLTIIKNDGLTEVDFKHWFKKDVISGIIIHFSPLRY